MWNKLQAWRKANRKGKRAFERVSMPQAPTPLPKTENADRQAGLFVPAAWRGRPLCVVMLSYMLGICLGYWFQPEARLMQIVAALIVIMAAVGIGLRHKFAAVLLFLTFAAVGCFSAVGAVAAVESFPIAAGEPVQLTGRAAQNSLDRGEGRYRLLMDVQQVNGRPWQGRVYLYYEGGPLLRGDNLLAQGELLPAQAYGNFAAFDYEAYLKRQGIAASVSCYFGGLVNPPNGWRAARESVRGRLVQAMEEAAGDDAAFLKGVFLGDKSDLNYAQRTDLSLAGVLHAFAVSGLHVGFLVTAVLLLVGQGRRKRWLRLGLVVLLLVFYTSLTGWPASVLRASMLSLGLLLAQAVDEKSDPYTSLAVAALLCLFYRPLWLFDAGFQLSFAAAFGIFYLLPVFRHLLGRAGKAAYFLNLFAVTLAASFATMPLISYYFHHISLIGWLISPFYVVAAGGAVVLCMVAACFAIFSVALAKLPLFVANLLMKGLDLLAAWGAHLPFATIASGQTPLWAVVVFYVALLALPVFWRRIKRRRLLTIAAMVLLILVLTLSPLLGHPGRGLLEVVFLDVGQGDAALVVTPAGRTILIDGGGKLRSPGTIGEQVLLPYLKARGIRSIDLMISSHPDMDHTDGLLTVLEYLPVRQLMYAEGFVENETQERLLAAAAENGAQLTPACRGMRFTLEEGLALTVYNPPAGADYEKEAANDGSLVCLLSYGVVDFLFTGDSAFDQLVELPTAEIVKLPHHGSGGAYDEAAYEQLAAEAVIFSVGRNNSYGHPHASVVEYWQGVAEIYRTDWQGAITIYTDGHTWQAETYGE